MRVMTWNIRNGGGSRRRAILEVIDRERPDVLALQELKGFDAYALSQVAEAVGMTGHLSPSVFGQPVAVLARPPLTLTRTRSVRVRLHHAAASAVVRTPAGPLTVVSTHLNPWNGYRRLREARWLAARFRSGHRHVLLAGDLNSLDPSTSHDDRLARLPERYRPRHLMPDGSVDVRAMTAFAEAGFVDLGRDGEPTAPTSQGGGAEFSGMRLDYLLATPRLARHASAARVVRGGAAEHASDHYPVVADLTDLTW